MVKRILRRLLDKRSTLAFPTNHMDLSFILKYSSYPTYYLKIRPSLSEML